LPPPQHLQLLQFVAQLRKPPTSLVVAVGVVCVLLRRPATWRSAVGVVASAGLVGDLRRLTVELRAHDGSGSDDSGGGGGGSGDSVVSTARRLLHSHSHVRAEVRCLRLQLEPASDPGWPVADLPIAALVALVEWEYALLGVGA